MRSTEYEPTVPCEVREEFLGVLTRLTGPGRNAAASRRHWGVTSSIRGEGVSTVVAQLALTAASSGSRRVLLVDANVVRPSIERMFGLCAGPGLSDVLLSGHSPCEVIRPSGVANLSLLTAGTVCQELALRCEQADLSIVLREVPEDFALVLFDLPSAERRSLLVRMAAALDGILLVVEAERVSGDEVRRTERILAANGLSLEGVLLNKSREYVPSWLRL